MKKRRPGRFSVAGKKIEIFHQPETAIANRIINTLRNFDEPISRVRILSAYASLNGVDILNSLLEKIFARNRNCDVRVSVGIDRGRTSYYALEKLLQLKGRFTNLKVFIVQDERSGYTFHPKLYCFESPTSSVFFVGSSNLTRAGLNSNYEIATKLTLESSDEGYTDFLGSVDRYFVPITNGIVRELSYELLSSLQKRGALVSKEREPRVASNLGKLFGRGSIEAKSVKVEFSRPPTKKKVPRSEIGLQLTHWDTDPRHSQTQISIYLMRSGFFPNKVGYLRLVFPDGKSRDAMLSHHQFHWRIANGEILDRLRARENDVLIITKLSTQSFRVRKIAASNVTNDLMSRLDQKHGKGKRWGWL